MPIKTPDGLPIDMAIASLKVALLPVGPEALSTSVPRVPLGPTAAQMALVKARGYTPVVVPTDQFSALPDDMAKAK
jgi:hypothetical protein